MALPPNAYGRWKRRQPSGVVAPTVSIAGTVAHGQVLTATAVGATSLQWYAGAVPISGETGTTYTVDRANGGYVTGITCRASNSAGTTISNALTYDSAARLPDTAIGIGVGMATDGDSWTPTLGGKAAVGALSAPASTNRPTYSLGGPDGRPMLTSDGVDDVLRIASLTMGGSWASWQIDLVGRAPTGQAAGRLFARYAPASNQIQPSIASNALRLQTLGVGGAVSAGSTAVDTTFRQLTFEAISGASGTQAVRVNNGAAEDTDAITHAAWADGATFAFFADSAGGTPIAGDFLAFAITRGATAADALDATQRGDLRQLLKEHTGI